MQNPSRTNPKVSLAQKVGQVHERLGGEVEAIMGKASVTGREFEVYL